MAGWQLPQTTASTLTPPPPQRRCRFIAIELPSADPLAEDPADIRAREGPEKHRGILAFGQLLKQLEGGTKEVAYANYGQSKLTRLLEVCSRVGWSNFLHSIKLSRPHRASVRCGVRHTFRVAIPIKAQAAAASAGQLWEVPRLVDHLRGRRELVVH